jgi:hypothetical protein
MKCPQQYERPSTARHFTLIRSVADHGVPALTVLGFWYGKVPFKYRIYTCCSVVPVPGLSLALS